jgi:hypothetical protein
MLRKAGICYDCDQPYRDGERECPNCGLRTCISESYAEAVPPPTWALRFPTLAIMLSLAGLFLRVTFSRR